MTQPLAAETSTPAAEIDEHAAIKEIAMPRTLFVSIQQGE